MRKLEDLMKGETGVFGPGTDLVVSLSAVLILVLAAQSILHKNKENALERKVEDYRMLQLGIDNLQQEIDSLQPEIDKLQQERDEYKDQLRRLGIGHVDLTEVKRNQKRLVQAVARQYPGIETVPIDEHRVGLDIDSRASLDIVFHNDVHRQRITFGSHILFEPDEVELSDDGEDVLEKLSRALRAELDSIEEIHIEGHADITPTRHGTNLKLAAKRAMTVFSELERLEINPYEIRMSATSFGDFMPVARFRANEEEYSLSRVLSDNATPAKKAINRRIELLLVYRR